jgi:hypothetical protein
LEEDVMSFEELKKQLRRKQADRRWKRCEGYREQGFCPGYVEYYIAKETARRAAQLLEFEILFGGRKRHE